MLNPWGDLIAMARSWCLVKPGGYGVVGVPTGPGDYIKLSYLYTIFIMDLKLILKKNNKKPLFGKSTLTTFCTVLLWFNC